MTGHTKPAALVLASALAIAIAAPLTAQAGTLTIFNQNCTSQKGFETHKRVTVTIDSKGGAGCTKTSVNVTQGQSKTVQLAAKDNDGNACGKYSHRAVGMLLGQQGGYDVDGDKDSSVTCKKDRSVSCRCVKS